MAEFAMSDIISAITSIVTASVGWVSSTVGMITSSPLLLFCTVCGFVGIGIGLVRRLMSLRA